MEKKVQFICLWVPPACFLLPKASFYECLGMVVPILSKSEPSDSTNNEIRGYGLRTKLLLQTSAPTGLTVIPSRPHGQEKVLMAELDRYDLTDELF